MCNTLNIVSGTLMLVKISLLFVVGDHITMRRHREQQTDLQRLNNRRGRSHICADGTYFVVISSADFDRENEEYPDNYFQ